MKIFRTLVCVVAAVLGAHADALAQQHQAPPPLVLYGDANFPPMSWMDNGEPKGLNVDVAKAVAQKMGRELRLELMNWSVAQARVKAGEASGLLAMTYSAERAEAFDFAVPTLSRYYSVFVRAGDVSIKSADDLVGKRVGVTLGGLPRTVLGARGNIPLVLIDSWRTRSGRRRPLGRCLLYPTARTDEHQGRRTALCQLTRVDRRPQRRSAVEGNRSGDPNAA